MAKGVTFKPIHGQAETEVVDVGLTFKLGQTLTGTDAEYDLLLKNRDFVDAKTGKNPNFTCANCGQYTADDVYRDPVSGPVQLYDADTQRRHCVVCYEKLRDENLEREAAAETAKATKKTTKEEPAEVVS